MKKSGNQRFFRWTRLVVGTRSMSTATRRAFDAIGALGRDDDDAHAVVGGTARAAVLVALVARDDDDGDGDDGDGDGDGDWDVILCVRAAGMRAHAGEVALPGGKRDAGSNERDVETAMREAEEEIGLPAGAVALRGALPAVLSRGLVSVRPIVGVVRRGRFDVWKDAVLSEEEVAEVFTAPLEMFLEARGHRFDDWAWPGATRAIRVHYFRHRGKTIWGLTATILIEVARRVFGREPEFQLGTDDGVTAWDVAERDGKTVVGVAARSLL